MFLSRLYFLFLFIILATTQNLTANPEKAPSDYTLTVKQFTFTGNTRFSSEQLSALLADYTGKPMTVDKIHEAKELVTRFYIAAGYVNSGVILPDQEVIDGLVQFQVIEGSLSTIIINQETSFHPEYIKGRLTPYTQSPLHLPTLQLPLYFLNNDPLIKTVHAELQPGKCPGEGELHLKLVEENPVMISMEFNNHKSPNIGALHRSIQTVFRNISGWNEVTTLRYGNTDGLKDYGVTFSLPINYHDTTLIINYDENASSVINDVFSNLDLNSESRCFSAGFRHPVFRNRNSELALALTLTLKRNKTTLLDFPYQYTAELDDGITRHTIVNFRQEWITRSARHAFTLRSTFDFGIRGFNATIVNHPADGRFVAWLGQVQYLRRLPFLNSQLLLKSNLRLADDELPPSEKFAIGGYTSVRGYRENILTGDEGFTAGLEWQVLTANIKCPGLSDGPEDGDLYLIPFADFGKTWNKEYHTVNTDIGSIGLGVRWLPRKNSVVEVFWGHALREFDSGDEYNLQDDGIHFKLNLSF